MTSEVIESLNECHDEKATILQACDMNWPSDLDVITLMSDTISVSREQLEELAREMSDENTFSRQVKASMVDLRWVFERQNNFVTLALVLNDLPNSFYSSKFMVLLLNSFWELAKKEIMYK